MVSHHTQNKIESPRHIYKICIAPLPFIFPRSTPGLLRSKPFSSACSLTPAPVGLFTSCWLSLDCVFPKPLQEQLLLTKRIKAELQIKIALLQSNIFFELWIPWTLSLKHMSLFGFSHWNYYISSSSVDLLIVHDFPSWATKIQTLYKWVLSDFSFICFNSLGTYWAHNTICWRNKVKNMDGKLVDELKGMMTPCANSLVGRSCPSGCRRQHPEHEMPWLSSSTQWRWLSIFSGRHVQVTK